MSDDNPRARIEAMMECRTCSAYREHPTKADTGECRRRAPVPLVLHWPTAPEVDEHGRLRGFRLTVWPGVSADDACMEYMPSAELMAQLTAQYEASMEASRH